MNSLNLIFEIWVKETIFMNYESIKNNIWNMNPLKLICQM